VVALKQKKNVAKTAILSPNSTPLYIYRITLSLYAYRLFYFWGQNRTIKENNRLKYRCYVISED